MVVAANKTNTTIHAFEYVKLQQAVDLAAHVGELGSITGTLRKIEPNPNKSRALVLRIYIDDATIAFSKALLGPPAVTVLKIQTTRLSQNRKPPSDSCARRLLFQIVVLRQSERIERRLVDYRRRGEPLIGLISGERLPSQRSEQSIHLTFVIAHLL